MKKITPLLTVPEAATALRVETHSLYRMIKQGLVPSIRLGSRKGIRLDIEAVKKACSVN